VYSRIIIIKALFYTFAYTKKIDFVDLLPWRLLTAPSTESILTKRAIWHVFADAPVVGPVTSQLSFLSCLLCNQVIIVVRSLTVIIIFRVSLWSLAYVNTRLCVYESFTLDDLPRPIRSNPKFSFVSPQALHRSRLLSCNRDINITFRTIYDQTIFRNLFLSNFNLTSRHDWTSSIFH